MEHSTIEFHTQAAYKQSIYTPFDLHMPSDYTLSDIVDEAAIYKTGVRRASIVFDDEGWTESPDFGQSTYNAVGAPIGDIWPLGINALIYCLWIALRRCRRKYHTVCLLLLALIPSQFYGAEETGIRVSSSPSRAGETLRVTPAVTDAPDGPSYLCWTLCYDPDCENELDDLAFTHNPLSVANTVDLSSPAPGTYYMRTVMRAVECNGEIVASAVSPTIVYPSDADFVLVRTNQADGEQIDLVADMPAEITAYGVLRFSRDRINDPSLSAYARYNYFVSFPFDVRVGDITGFGTYGRHWLIERYNGLARAQNGYWADSEPNWRRIDDTDSVLHANQGYLLKLNATRMAASNAAVWANGSDVATLYFPAVIPLDLATSANETIPALSEAYRCTIDNSEAWGNDDADRRNADSYWRCIGVPGYEGTWTTEDLTFLYEWNPATNALSVVSATDYTFRPMHAYLVQTPDRIIWVNTDAPSPVIRRRRDCSDREYLLTLHHDESPADRTYIRLSEDPTTTTDFDFGRDLSKEFNDGANIYTLVGSTRVAGNCLPPSDSTLLIPIGLRVAESGDYTLAMPDAAEGITLIDRLIATRTPLALSSYTVHLDAGIADQRFVLELSASPQTITGFSSSVLDSQSSAARKLMIGGQLFILRDACLYDARGARIK